MQDLISRQAAIDAIEKAKMAQTPDGEIYVAKYNAEMNIQLLPSAQPERKMGKWIYNSPMTMKCDQCGFVIKDWDWHRFKYCPNCRANMRGEQE